MGGSLAGWSNQKGGEWVAPWKEGVASGKGAPWLTVSGKPSLTSQA